MLIGGDDESLVRAAVTDLVHRLVGAGDRSLMVDEFDGDEYELRSVVDAAQTMPFLTDRRIVLARGLGRFTADELAPLLDYLADPLTSTDLVLVAGGGRLPKAFHDAVKRAGAEVIDASPPSRPRDRQAWIGEQAADAGVRLSGAAATLIAERLGEDAGRADGILATLAATYGAGRALGPADVEPFLGEGGGVPPWDLTDAIDRGDTARALALLARMTGAGGRHPLQVMAILHGHYARLARLDGADVRTDDDAAATLGIKPGFPAKKALQQYRRLGGPGVHRAVELLASADLDLRGAKDLDDDVVMDVLVARLSRLRR
jgi:DNA polymerase-3 subunit delta